jgi:hypothetical protein
VREAEEQKQSQKKKKKKKRQQHSSRRKEKRKKPLKLLLSVCVSKQMSRARRETERQVREEQRKETPLAADVLPTTAQQRWQEKRKRKRKLWKVQEQAQEERVTTEKAQMEMLSSFSGEKAQQRRMRKERKAVAYALRGEDCERREICYLLRHTLCVSLCLSLSLFSRFLSRSLLSTVAAAARVDRALLEVSGLYYREEE